MKRVFATFLALALMPWASGAFAHDGPHPANVLVEVHEVKLKGAMVHVVLRLTSLNGTATLNSIAAPGAKVLTFQPVPVPFAKDTFVTSVMTFAAPPLQAFTAVLDFGAAGQEPVAIAPGF